MVLNEETNTNMKDYWESGYSDNDPNGDKHLSSVYDVIAHGNFRSALVDDWFLEPPHEVIDTRTMTLQKISLYKLKVISLFYQA